MKFKEQIMQIVLKAEYYQVKQKCKMIEIDFLSRTLTRIIKKNNFLLAPFVLFETLILPSEEFAKNMKKYRGNFSYISQDIAYIICDIAYDIGYLRIRVLKLFQDFLSISTAKLGAKKLTSRP